jgi:hypothetical protein
MSNNINFNTFKENGFTNEQISQFQSSYNQEELEYMEYEKKWLSLVSNMLEIINKENSLKNNG